MPILRPRSEAQALSDVLKLYRGRYTTISAIQEQLRERGVFVSRETVRRKLKEVPHEEVGRGLYKLTYIVQARSRNDNTSEAESN